MNYNISLVVESELGDIVCELSTSAGISDLEENVIRKCEVQIKKYEAEKEVEEQMEIDRLAELEDGEGKPDTELKQELEPY